MYGVVLLAAMTTSAQTPDLFHGRGHGCHGCFGGWGCRGCYGCSGCYGGSGCYGCSGCYGGYGCSGCYGGSGCHGWAIGYGGPGACYGACYGYGYSGWSGGFGCYGCYGGDAAPMMPSAPIHGGSAIYGGCWGQGWSCYGGCGGYSNLGYMPVGTVSGPIASGLPVETKVEPTKPKVEPDDSSSLSPRARLVVELPADTKLYVDDRPINVTKRKSFLTPPLESGATYYYEVRAELMRDGKPIATETRRVVIRAGQEVREDFRAVLTERAARATASAR
jgi:uncharacterized protein (TIGR03000 family)